MGISDVANLPFVLKIVRTEAQLQKVCQLRALAYGRHLPFVGARLVEPEPLDRHACALIFLAEDKTTGEAVGTARIQVNLEQPLQIEDSVEIPPDFKSHTLTEITRFSVLPGYNQPSVRPALFKASYLYCCAMQLRYMLIGARRPLDRIYEALGFDDVFGRRQFFPLRHANGIEHRLLKFDVYGAERAWFSSQHPLYGFMLNTYHPDIQVFSAVSSAWARPRVAEAVGGR